MSVHKAQGQTLERVKIDLHRTFENGQAYVALSRATQLETLEVRNFDASKVKAHPRVIEWMRQYMKQSKPAAPSPFSSYSTMDEEEEDDFAYMDEEEAISAYYEGQR